jgi:hypothetical protein
LRRRQDRRTGSSGCPVIDSRSASASAARTRLAASPDDSRSVTASSRARLDWHNASARLHTFERKPDEPSHKVFH